MSLPLNNPYRKSNQNGVKRTEINILELVMEAYVTILLKQFLENKDYIPIEDTLHLSMNNELLFLE